MHVTDNYFGFIIPGNRTYSCYSSSNTDNFILFELKYWITYATNVSMLLGLTCLQMEVYTDVVGTWRPPVPETNLHITKKIAARSCDFIQLH